MGKKYVIEFEDKPICEFDKNTQTYMPRLWKVKGFNSLVFDDNGIKKLKPLSEYVDEAYNTGFKTGYIQAEYDQGTYNEIKDTECKKEEEKNNNQETDDTDTVINMGLDADEFIKLLIALCF